jgi:hypothetical protein|tara:strand:+ start:475 stop:708 length:234 start_codon:yes stop_codon:yes gene_type:complete
MGRYMRECYEKIVEDPAKIEAFQKADAFGWDNQEELAGRYADNLQKSSGIELSAEDAAVEIGYFLAETGYDPYCNGV